MGSQKNVKICLNHLFKFKMRNVIENKIQCFRKFMIFCFKRKKIEAKTKPMSTVEKNKSIA